MPPAQDGVQIVFTLLNDQVNVGGSAMSTRNTFLHDGAVLAHVVTQQGSRSSREDSLRKQVIDT